MSDQSRDAMQERSKALLRDWHTKHKALAELQTRFVSSDWGWPRIPVPPVPSRDVDAAIRETQNARDAEGAAWQAYVQAFLALAQSGLDSRDR